MLKTLELPKTGMAITIDLGDAKDIHPKNKQEVGKRLSYWALGTVYGKQVPAISGPIATSSNIQGNAIRVAFQHTNGGLKSISGGPLTGFEIAGADQQWKKADAKIVGEAVVISSPDVTMPWPCVTPGKIGPTTVCPTESACRIALPYRQLARTSEVNRSANT